MFLTPSFTALLASVGLLVKDSPCKDCKASLVLPETTIHLMFAARTGLARPTNSISNSSTASSTNKTSIGGYFAVSNSTSSNANRTAIFAVSNGTISTTSRTSIITRISKSTPSTSTSASRLTSGTPSTIATTIQGDAYNGCYSDKPSRVMSAKTYTSQSMTVKSCLSFCSGFTYAGVQYGRECYCGNTISPSSNKTPESDCNVRCLGNNSETCGGHWRLSTYKLANGDAKLNINNYIPSSRSFSSTFSSSLQLPTTLMTATRTQTSAASPSPTSAGSDCPPQKVSSKRGLAYTSVRNTNLFLSTICSPSRISWAYNWGQTPGPAFSSSLEYTPMLWSPSTNHVGTWTRNLAAQPGSKYILGFNEPDHKEQANMDVAAAVAAWKQYIEPLSAQGYKLGAPAVTNGPAPMGLDWLRRFLAACSNCTVDFIPIHWYDRADNAGYFKSYVQQAFEAGGGQRKVWITEFEGEGSPEQQTAFLKDVLPWLDASDMVERYAWFMADPGYLLGADGQLNAVGQVYRSYGG